MIKRWKGRAKFWVTSIVIAGYVTIGLFNNAISRVGKSNERTEEEAAAAAAAAAQGTLKTIIGYSMEYRMREEMMMTEEVKCEGGKAPDDDGTTGWKRDENLDIFVFSAYYDTRMEPYNYVRIIGLLPRNASFYCQIWYEKNEKQTFVVRKAIIHEIWSTNWGYENSCARTYPSLISCPAPIPEDDKDQIPTKVTFVDRFCCRSNVTVSVSQVKKSDESFVICVKALNYTHHVNDYSLREWIELNERLGAGKIVVYVTRLHPIDMDILKEYQDKNFVHLLRFEPLDSPIATYEEYLWQKRKLEIIVYNDCFYRNILSAKFVIPLDIDEIIVPKIGNNWYEAFISHFGKGDESKWPSALDEYSSFSVRNAYFFAKYPKEALLRDLMLPNGDKNVSEYRKLVSALLVQLNLGPKDSIFRRNVRSFHFSPESDSTKSFVHVPKTLSVFNHYAFHVLGEVSRQYIFPEGILQLNHYRNSCDPLLIDGCHNFLRHIKLDDSLEKFRNQIPFVKNKL